MLSLEFYCGCYEGGLEFFVSLSAYNPPLRAKLVQPKHNHCYVGTQHGGCVGLLGALLPIAQPLCEGILRASSRTLREADFGRSHGTG